MSQIPIGHIGLIDPIARLHSKPDWVLLHILKDPICRTRTESQTPLASQLCQRSYLFVDNKHTRTNAHSRKLSNSSLAEWC